MGLNFVETWVNFGYDSDEFLGLGPIKAFEFLIRITQEIPSIQNEVFARHIQAFLMLIKSALKVKNTKKLPDQIRIFTQRLSLRQAVRLQKGISIWKLRGD